MKRNHNLLLTFLILSAIQIADAQVKPVNPFLETNPDDVYWDDQFGPTALGGGSDPTVFASLVAGDDIYFAGEFEYAGEKTVNHIVRWDGTNWNALGEGTDGVVMAIAEHNEEIYIGGRFLMAGGDTVNNIAKWDGTHWSALGGGVSGNSWMTTVYALTFIGDDLYAGGKFQNAGSVAAHYIARWDGTQWSDVSGGVTGIVRALTTENNNLYVGGDFTWAGPVAGGTWAYYVARYDGAQWHSLGNGMDKAVYCLGTGNEGIYAGGKFTIAGDAEAHYLARWDGSVWSAVDNGIVPMTDGSPVNALAISGNDLYIGGNFDITIDPYDCLNFAKWDGSSWSGCGYGFLGYQQYTAVHTVGILDDNVYAGGYFTSNSGVSLRDLGRWDGVQWNPVGTGFGNGMDAWVNTMAVMGNDLWVGGRFEHAGDKRASYIARWNGTDWYEPDMGTGYEVRSIMPLGSDLYVVGAFTTVGNQVATGPVVRWDGSTWHAVGQGYHATVYTLTHIGDDIYIGENGAVVKKWDGVQWAIIGTLGGTVEGAYALAVIGDDLYAGGTFNSANGIPANYIAKWDGTQWSALGSGMNGGVKALCVIGSDLYAGGYFTQAGGNDAAHLARWDGSQWWPVGGGLNGSVMSLANIDGELYVGGVFTQAGSMPAVNAARWNGSEWKAFGSGTNECVSAFAKVGEDIYMGGNFQAAGNKSSAFLGRWLKWPVGGQNYSDAVKDKELISVYPNPAIEEITINLTCPSEDPADLLLYTPEGKLLMKKIIPAGTANLRIQTGSLPSGLYLLRFQQRHYSVIRKLIKL